MKFMRMFLFWIVLEETLFLNLGRPVILSLRYLGVMFAITIWRLFFFENQNASYSYVALQLIRENPLLGIWSIAKSILFAFWETIPHAWIFPFELTSTAELGTRVSLLAGALVIISTLAIAVYLFFFGKTASSER